jgi:DNA-binding GntR family transcriptional regulator
LSRLIRSVRVNSHAQPIAAATKRKTPPHGFGIDGRPKASRDAEDHQLPRDTRALEAAFRQKPPDYDRRLTLHRRFHVRLTDASARPRLRALLEAVLPHAERYEWIYGRLLPQGIRSAAREHDVISRAIQDGAPNAARIAVEANWANAARRLARQSANKKPHTNETEAARRL